MHSAQDTAGPGLPACVKLAVALDFETKVLQDLSFAQALDALRAGRFVWIDVLAQDLDEAQRVLARFELLDDETIEAALHKDPATQHARYERYLHIVVSECQALGSGFELSRVDFVISEQLFLTIHRKPTVLLEAVRREYKDDFVRFAKSPSFLVYELWDHLLESYLSVQKLMEERVEELQLELRQHRVDDAVFGRIAELGADLLHFRKIVLPARAVLGDLATRRSLFVSEATQRFLGNMVGTVEHVLQDLLVDKDILSEALHLHMSMVGHRTNEVMRRLTLVSVVFLPLSFLAGIYGMNFRQPEYDWPHGYGLFWLLALSLVVVSLTLLRRAKLL